MTKLHLFLKAMETGSFQRRGKAGQPQTTIFSTEMFIWVDKIAGQCKINTLLFCQDCVKNSFNKLLTLLIKILKIIHLSHTPKYLPDFRSNFSRKWGTKKGVLLRPIHLCPLKMNSINPIMLLSNYLKTYEDCMTVFTVIWI